MKQVLPGSGVTCQASAWKTPPTPFFIISQRRPIVCYWHHWKRMEPCAVPMVIDSIELESQIDHILHEHYLRKLAFRFSYLLCCYWVGGHTWKSEDSSEKSVFFSHLSQALSSVQCPTLLKQAFLFLLSRNAHACIHTHGNTHTCIYTHTQHRKQNKNFEKGVRDHP